MKSWTSMVTGIAGTHRSIQHVSSRSVLAGGVFYRRHVQHGAGRWWPVLAGQWRPGILRKGYDDGSSYSAAQRNGTAAVPGRTTRPEQQPQRRAEKVGSAVVRG